MNVGSLVFFEIMEVVVEVATHRTLPVSVDLSLNILLPSLSHLQLKGFIEFYEFQRFYEKLCCMKNGEKCLLSLLEVCPDIGEEDRRHCPSVWVK